MTIEPSILSVQEVLLQNTTQYCKFLRGNSIERFWGTYSFLWIVHLNHGLVVSGFSEHEKTKQETDTLYQSPVPDLEKVGYFDTI